VPEGAGGPAPDPAVSARHPWRLARRAHAHARSRRGMTKEESSMNKRIATDGAPAALGPYSQGIDDGGHVFVSGQVGIDPVTGRGGGGIGGPAQERSTQPCA